MYMETLWKTMLPLTDFTKMWLCKYFLVISNGELVGEYCLYTGKI